jgi:hypothetical protein
MVFAAGSRNWNISSVSTESRAVLKIVVLFVAEYGTTA